MELVLTPDQIRSRYNLNYIVAEILYNRGIFTSKSIEEYLYADFNDLYSPFDIPGVIEVSEIIKESAYFGDKIVIYSDYDVDGITSAAILYKAILKKAKKANVSIYVSNRFVDGYGLSIGAIDKMAEEGTDLLITLDCGISNHEEIEYAKNKGIKVCVIDHHESSNPPNVPFVDLKASQGDYPFRELCGAGVTYKVAQALLEDPFYEMVDLVAVATVADVVDLIGENRILVKAGLDKIRSGNANPGLQELINIRQINCEDFQSYHIGFQIGPLINAIGRMSSAAEAVELFLTDNPTRRKQIAHKLDQINLLRQEKQASALNRALTEIDPTANVIMYQDERIEAGIVGLVAGDLKEKFNKPVIVIGGGGKGSCRSVNPLNIYMLLEECSEYFEQYGGHAMAAGLSIKEGVFDELYEKIQELTEGIEYEPIIPDMDIELKDITWDLIEGIERMAPFGKGNPKPKFKTKNCELSSISVTRDGKHLRFRARDESIDWDIQAIGFQMSDKEDLCKQGKVNLIYQPDINEWRGQKSLQLLMRDIEKAG